MRDSVNAPLSFHLVVTVERKHIKVTDVIEYDISPQSVTNNLHTATQNN